MTYGDSLVQFLFFGYSFFAKFNFSGQFVKQRKNEAQNNA